MEEILESAGLSKNEIKVYLALLRLRSALAGEIAKKSGVHRRNVYDALEKLIEKGLVSYLMHGTRRYFQAEDPKRLVDIMKSREEQIKSLLPELRKRYEGKKREEAKIFRGRAGLKTVLDDQIDRGKEILVFGTYGKFDTILKYYFPQFEKRRLKKGVKVKLIFDEGDRGKELAKELVQARYIPKFWTGPVATNICGNKVYVIVWAETPLIFQIEHKEIADAYRRYFKTLWKIAKK